MAENQARPTPADATTKPMLSPDDAPTPEFQFDFSDAPDMGGASPFGEIDFSDAPGESAEPLRGPDNPEFLTGPAPYEQTMEAAEQTLRDAGYTDEQIQMMVSRDVNGVRQMPADLLGRMYTTVAPVFIENRDKIAAAAEWAEQANERGADINATNFNGLRAMASMMLDSGVLERAGELYGAQKEVKRGFWSKVAQYSPYMVQAWNAGLTALDSYTRANNRFRIFQGEVYSALTGKDNDEAIAELKLKYLPKVRVRTLGGSEREFDSAASAQFVLGIERSWGMAGALAYGAAEKITGGLGLERMQEFFQGKHEAAREVFLNAATLVPAAPGGLTPNLTNWELAENIDPEGLARAMMHPAVSMTAWTLSPEERADIVRQVKEEGDTWPAWSAVNDAGVAGTIDMAKYALVDTAAEVTNDIGTVVAFGAPKVVTGLRKAARAAAPEKVAKITSVEAAGGSMDPETVRTAVENARYAAGRVEKAVQNLIDQGKPVPGELVERMANARRQVIVEERWLRRLRGGVTDEEMQVLRTVRRDPSWFPRRGTSQIVEKEIAVSDPTRQLDMFQPRPADIQKQRVKVREGIPVEELARERQMYRRRALERDPDWQIEHSANERVTRARSLFGPDSAEEAGDGLNILARGELANIEDVAMRPLAPEINYSPNKVITQLEWQKVDDVLRTERKLGISGGAAQYELGVSTQRMLARQQHRVRQSLGAARRAGDKEIIPALEQQSKQIDEALKKVGNAKSFSKKWDSMEYSDKWLPQARGSIVEDQSKLNRWLDVAADKALRAVHPGALIYRMGHSGFGQATAPLRDPIRFFETYNPAMADHLRVSYARFERNLQAYNERAINIFEEAGVMVKRKGGDFEVNAARSRDLWKLLNEKKDSEKWKFLYNNADEKLQRAHDRVRVMMDDYADVQQLGKDVRYLEGYMRHMLTPETWADAARPIEMVGLHRNAEVYAAHLLDRNGANKEWVEDIVSVFDLYNRAASRKLYLEPMFEDLKVAAQDLVGQYGNTRLANYAHTLVDFLQGKPSLLSTLLDDLGGRAGRLVKMPDGTQKVLAKEGSHAIERGLQGVTSLIWANNIAGNPRYGLMQITAGSATTASRFGAFRTLEGLLRFGTKEGQALAKELGFYGTVEKLMEHQTFHGFTEKLAKYTGINMTEAYSRGLTAHAAIGQAMSDLGFHSWQEAVSAGADKRILHLAMRAAESANHMYGPLGKTPYVHRAFGRSAAGAGTQFVLYPLKQTEELISQANQNIGYIGRYLALSGYMAHMFARTGYDVTQWVGLGFTDEMGEGLPESPLADLFGKQMDLLAAMAAGNPQDINFAGQAFQNALDMFTPVILRDAAKRMSNLSGGEQTDYAGRKVRDLDFGGIDPMDPGTWTGEGLADAVAQGGERLGGDLIPNLMMGPSIKERITRVNLRQQRTRKNTMREAARDLVRRMADALEDGETAKAAEIAQELQDTYQIRVPNLGSRLERELITRYLGAQMRALTDSPTYGDILWEMIQGQGAQLQ